MMKVIFLLYLIFCISFPIHGNTHTSVPLLPRPQKIEYHKGKYFFHLKDSCKIPSDKLSTQLTDTLSEVPLNQHEAYKLEVTPEQYLYQGCYSNRNLPSYANIKTTNDTPTKNDLHSLLYH